MQTVFVHFASDYSLTKGQMQKVSKGIPGRPEAYRVVWFTSTATSDGWLIGDGVRLGVGV